MTEPISKKVDQALDMTFPASDPPALSGSTSTEEPGRPADREAIRPRPEDVENAGSPKGDEEALLRQRHRGVGREGLSPADPAIPPGDGQGLGHEGANDQASVLPVPTTREVP